MSNIFVTPNMGLPSPIPGSEDGPQWATDLYNCMNLLDAHTHAPGSGVQITPAAINVNATLPFNSNAATSVAYLNVTPQAAGIPTPINYSLYFSGVDLYAKDGSGNAIQITSGGGVNATSSGISSGTASAAFVSSVLVVTQSTGVGAAVDASSYILRYNGSYPSPSGNAVVLAAPSSLATAYQVTFPATTPAANGAFYTMSTAGALSYTNVDNSTLEINSATILVKAGGITTNEIAASTIVAANIAAGTITTTQIAASTITGSNLASNINLPGNAVQENGKNVVVSNTNAASSLAIVRGTVAANGSITLGEGFTVGHGVTGTYAITFSASFASAPSVVATCFTPSAAVSAIVTAISASACTIVTFDISGAALDEPFSFIVIGPRA